MRPRVSTKVVVVYLQMVVEVSIRVVVVGRVVVTSVVALFIATP